jgi:hypothetical protein
MAAPELTSAAAAEIGRLVHESKHARPVVLITWDTGGVDNLRGPSGETIWKRVSDGGWLVFVVDYKDLNLDEANARTTIADGYEFLDIYRDRYGRQIEKPKLDFRSGEFVVANAAI